MAKVLTLPIKPEMPDPARRKAKPRKPDPRYVEGQRLLVEAMKYLIQQDPQRKTYLVFLLSHAKLNFLPNFEYLSHQESAIVNPGAPFLP